MFLKIGDLYINQDHIEVIKVEDEWVSFCLDIVIEGGRHWISFCDDERQAILDWLDYKAEVSVVC